MLSQMTRPHSFLWFTNAPFCVYVCVRARTNAHVFVGTFFYMCHMFIHSSMDGPLGCSHVLLTVNNATVNIVISVFVLLGKYPMGELLGHMLILLLIFKRTPYCFS